MGSSLARRATAEGIGTFALVFVAASKTPQARTSVESDASATKWKQKSAISCSAPLREAHVRLLTCSADCRRLVLQVMEESL